jgi:hypothetical protein
LISQSRIKQTDSQNENYLGQDGLIHNIYYGDQSVASVKQVDKELHKLVKTQRQNGVPVLIFSDISKLGKVSLKVRLLGADIVKNLDFDKAAIYGPSKVLEELVNFVILASGKAFQIKFFVDKSEAKSWLKS